ncbi:MAG TPA: M20/M25/M40 family metallo-hydrolase [Aggregatilineaceae bacterium]|nr:M20/M25/M40 family metallo-hydrolase [Aggregatilineaceae bacterium]
MHQSVQALQKLANSPLLSRIREQINIQDIVDSAIRIQQIASPTFAEERRAVYIQSLFERYPLRDVHTDEVYNVYGCWPGTDSTSPALLISAHTDTVFAADADLTIQRKDTQIYGPGLGDNSLGVAGLLFLLDVCQKHHIQPAADIWFVANSREEGLGDLGGIRAVWDHLKDRLGAAVVLEGMALGRIYHGGIAVRRWRITCRAPGGHSWLHFGQPSAIHGLVELGAQIVAIIPPVSPRTTYNIGLISGGQSVNSIATTAEFYLDMRSEDSKTLQALEQQVMDAIKRVSKTDLTFEIDVVGDRPSGYISPSHPLVQMAAAALDVISHPVFYESGSTDANVLLANGLPTVTIGISYGGHAHRPDEYIETTPLADGVWHVILLALTVADQMKYW